jgi:phage-related tail fiber protein
MLIRPLLAATFLAMTAAVWPAIAQVTEVAVQFKSGESGATITNTITGEEAVNYTLSAMEGQSMVVIMETDNPSNYFNVMAPGAASAMFIGSTSGGRFEGTLPATGIYTIQVYLMRNASRRNESASYRLDVGIN